MVVVARSTSITIGHGGVLRLARREGDVDPHAAGSAARSAAWAAASRAIGTRNGEHDT